MKYAKRFASLLLALVMILSMSVTAFADEKTGSITIDNPQKEQNYTAYKIFDVVYSDAQDAYSYTISEDSEWFGVVASKDSSSGVVTSKIAGLKFQKAFSEDTYVVIKESGFSAAAFANTLKANTAGKKGTALSVSEGKATASNLDLGYYFVTSSTGALCNLTTTDPDVTIHDKNDIPFEKTDDKDSVEVGEVVSYVVTGKVPDYTGFETFKYQITDKMSDGLTFNDDVKVYINENELTDTNKYTLKTGGNAGEKAFVLDIEVMELPIGAKIEVKYTATVNENAVAKVEKNHATLEYSNDPNDANQTTTREDEETVYSAKIVIDKYAKGNETKKLEGAQFVLMNNEGKYYKYTEAAGTEKAKVDWVVDQKGATVVTTDKNGAGYFDGLKDGTYQLKEIAAPDGYNLLPDTVEITINGADATETDLESLTVTGKVENNTGAELPSTGGRGTAVFYIVGGILVAGAVVLLITKKRMGKER